MTTSKGADKGTMNVDADLVRQLAELLDEANLTEIEVEDGSRSIRVSRAGSAVAVAAPAPVAAPVAPAPAAHQLPPLRLPHRLQQRKISWAQSLSDGWDRIFGTRTGRRPICLCWRFGIPRRYAADYRGDEGHEPDHRR